MRLPLRPAPGILGFCTLLATTPAGAADLATIPPGALAAQAEEMGGGVVTSGSPLGGPALRLPATPAGTALSLPGSLPWARARFLTFDTLVEGLHSGRVLVRFFAAGELEPRLTVSLGLLPGLETPIAVPLSALEGRTLVLPRTPGRLTGRVRGRRLDPGEIARVQIQLEETAGPQTLFMGPVSLGVDEPRLRLPRRAPLVDEMGQWNAKEWEGKTETDALLGTWLTFALEKDRDATFPGGWCPRGGSTETTFEATGFFRTEHDGERWWLVDPEGHAFFSLGLGAVLPGEPAAVVPGSEALFGRLLPRGGPMAGAWGTAAASGMETYSYALANLIRSFGPRWREDWTAMTRSRLIGWRFNTVGGGSDPLFAGDADLPWVLSMPPYPTTGTLLFRDFPDVFAEEFRSSAETWARNLASHRDDPSLIGYFMQSEPQWALGGRNIASEMLEAHPGTQTRRALAHWLQKRYKDDAADWSVAWGLGLRTFDDVVDALVLDAAERSEAARRDLWEFSKEMVRAYVGIPGLACHEVDSDHLNLGMRYAGLPSELLYEAIGVFDVFSIDVYDMVPPAETLAEIATRTRRPVLIGAFEFGALDRGLPSTGPRGVESQNERGIAYRRYVERAAADPHLVGAHYSALSDEPLLGDPDGENDQVGFIDVCHRPYKELVDSARRAHRSVYELRLGKEKPYVGKALEIPAVSRLLAPPDWRETP